MSFGEVGEDGTWRLRLNEFAHVLKLASRVPPGVEGALQRRLDNLPYNARQVRLGAYFGRKFAVLVRRSATSLSGSLEGGWVGQAGRLAIPSSIP